VRAVFDTNVLISAHFWHGAPNLLFAEIRNWNIRLVISPELMAEFAAVIGRAKFDPILQRTGRTRPAILGALRQVAEMIDPPPLPIPVCRDPEDDKVLALARAALPDFIVSGDKDLLTLGNYAGIEIIKPADALTKLQQP